MGLRECIPGAGHFIQEDKGPELAGLINRPYQ